MINGINSISKCNPSFGMAQLNDFGKQVAKELEQPRNKYLNQKMYEKQGWREPAAIQVELQKGKGNFSEICEKYGCTNNAKANADFIRNQVLSKKGYEATKKVDELEYYNGLNALYTANYDNPELSSLHTTALLKQLKGTIPNEKYIQQVGLLSEGTLN